MGREGGRKGWRSSRFFPVANRRRRTDRCCIGVPKAGGEEFDASSFAEEPGWC